MAELDKDWPFVPTVMKYTGGLSMGTLESDKKLYKMEVKIGDTVVAIVNVKALDSYIARSIIRDKIIINAVVEPVKIPEITL